MRSLSDKHPAVRAAAAHTDLSLFAAVVALLEHSIQSSAREDASRKIIAIAEAEQQRCLRRYDRALAELPPEKDRP